MAVYSPGFRALLQIAVLLTVLFVSVCLERQMSSTHQKLFSIIVCSVGSEYAASSPPRVESCFSDRRKMVLKRWRWQHSVIRDDRDTNVNTCCWIEMKYSPPGNNKMTFMYWVDVNRIEKNRNELICFLGNFNANWKNFPLVNTCRQSFTLEEKFASKNKITINDITKHITMNEVNKLRMWRYQNLRVRELFEIFKKWLSIDLE